LLLRKQRRVDGKKQNYWLDTATGLEYSSKPLDRRKHKSNADTAAVLEEQLQRCTGRFSLIEQVQYSYEREHSTLDKQRIAALLDRNQYRAFENVHNRYYWARLAADREFKQLEQWLVWDTDKLMLSEATESTEQAFSVPLVHYSMQDYSERCRGLAERLVKAVQCSSKGLTIELVKEVLKVSDREAIRWRNAVVDALSVCTATETTQGVPF
jgi:hypothetical protein